MVKFTTITSRLFRPSSAISAINLTRSLLFKPIWRKFSKYYNPPTTKKPLAYKISRIRYIPSLQMRQESTDTAKKQMRKLLQRSAPHPVADRYAKTLYAIAAKRNVLTQIHSDLIRVYSLMTVDSTCRCRFIHPDEDVATEEDVLYLLDQIPSLSPMTAEFLRILVENDRIDLLMQIIASFSTMMTHYKELECEVITAHPLEEGKLEEIQNNVEKAFTYKNPVKLKYTVDPSIVGGIIIKIDDYLVDMSVASRFRKYEEILTKTTPPEEEKEDESYLVQ